LTDGVNKFGFEFLGDLGDIGALVKQIRLLCSLLDKSAAYFKIGIDYRTALRHCLVLR